MESSKLSISVIIPTLNSSGINETLKALVNQNKGEYVLDIIVAGKQTFDNSEDTCQIRYIEVEDQPSPARNRNIGVDHSLSEWILFTDSDCVPCENWVNYFIEEFSSSYSIIAGTVEVPEEMSYWGLCDHYVSFGDQARNVYTGTTLPYAATLNFCIRKELFLRLGGLNEIYTTAGGEDRDLCYRAGKIGEKILLAQKADVVHRHSRSDLRSAWDHISHYGEITVRFRFINVESQSWYWKFSSFLVRIPFLGEITAILRSLFHIFIRLCTRPYYLRQIQLLPGLLVLTFALYHGMVREIRKQKSHRHYSPPEKKTFDHRDDR